MDEQKTIDYQEAVKEIRKACRQYAMLYFHFSKVLVDEFGVDKAKPLIQKAIFQLGIDRTDQLREEASKENLPCTMETFMEITDLPMMAWVKELGTNHCPYAETWTKYFEEFPWFKEIAPFYCDVIDTTNAENFTQKLSHRITENVLTGGKTCERLYFDSQDVSEGVFTYGKNPKEKQER